MSNPSSVAVTDTKTNPSPPDDQSKKRGMDLSAVRPDGEFYEARVPDTLDLAERAARFIDGTTKSLLRYTSTVDGVAIDTLIPPGTGIFGEVSQDRKSTSTYLGFVLGPNNWGKIIKALILARRMSGYDLDDAKGTLSRQQVTMDGMLSPEVMTALLSDTRIPFTHYMNAPLLDPKYGVSLTPTTVVAEALIEQYREKPNAALKALIQDLVTKHSTLGLAKTGSSSDEIFYFNERIFPFPLSNSKMDPYFFAVYGPLNSYVGNFGFDWVYHFIHGAALRMLTSWFLVSKDHMAMETAFGVSKFLLNHGESIFWRTIHDGMPKLANIEVPTNPVQVVNIPKGFGGYGEDNAINARSHGGHDHSFLTMLMGLLGHAEALLASKDLKSAMLATAIIELVAKRYETERDQWGRGAIGNFGETCSVGDMTRIAIKLTKLGAKNYFEDVTNYVENSLTEAQIDEKAASYIPSEPSDDTTRDRVGNRVIGTFFSDSTHVLNIPIPDKATIANPAKDPFRQTICCQANATMGLYAAWDSIVDYDGNVATVNLLLNRASKYVDVTSELPYRGVVHIAMKNSDHAVSRLKVRIPQWVAQNTVQVKINGALKTIGAAQTAPVHWRVSGGANYLVFLNPGSDSRYKIEFPMAIIKKPITVLKEQTEHWLEANLPSWNSLITPKKFTGIFRGNTLVDVEESRPAGGVPRYVRDHLKTLPLDLSDDKVPHRQVRRFVPNLE